MKSHSKESGSVVHIVVIIVLIVAVLGLLGFVFWQNFMNKPAANDNSSQTSTQQQDSNSDVVSNAKTLVVTDWGIKGTYETDQTFSYEVFPTDPNALLLKKGDLLACGKGIGAVYRLKSDEKSTFFGASGEEKTAKEIYTDNDVSYKAFIGDYYYFLKDASTACSSDNVSNEDRAELIQATKDFVSSIESAN